MHEADESQGAAWRAHLSAGLVLLAMLVVCQASVLRDGMSRVILTTPELSFIYSQELREVDQRCNVYSVARVANKLSRDPLALHETEMCYPEPHRAALWHSLTTLGFVAIPAWLVTGEPIAAYNFALFCMLAALAAGLYLLVHHWTGNVLAALAAALAGAFHASVIDQVTHPWINDLGWGLIAVYLGLRYLETERMAYAAWGGVFAALQIASNLYSVYATLLVTVPLALLAAWRYGIRYIRPRAFFAFILPSVVAAHITYAPYIAIRRAFDGAIQAATVSYMPWTALVPGQAWLQPVVGQGLKTTGIPNQFPGFVLLALVILGFVLRSKQELDEEKAPTRRAPLVALIVIAGVVVAVATGGNAMARLAAEAAGEAPGLALPNLHELARALLPGIGSIRMAAYVYPGMHVALALAAGIGAATLLARVRPTLRSLVGLAVVALIVAECLFPPLLPRPLADRHRTFAIKPDEETLRFWRELSRVDGDGPVLEVPIAHPIQIREASIDVLATAYHHRPTSSCHVSYRTPAITDIREQSRRLPSREAVADFAALGFETLVVHRDRSPVLAERIERAARLPDSGLRLLLKVGNLDAYAMAPRPYR